MSKKREEFASQLRKSKKQEVLLKKRMEILAENSVLPEESIERLSKCNKIFSNADASLV